MLAVLHLGEGRWGTETVIEGGSNNKSGRGRKLKSKKSANGSTSSTEDLYALGAGSIGVKAETTVDIQIIDRSPEPSPLAKEEEFDEFDGLDDFVEMKKLELRRPQGSHSKWEVGKRGQDAEDMV